jgi:flagellar motor switch protein FliN/FliY
MADESQQIGQDEIEQLLRQAQRAGAQAAKQASESSAAGSPPEAAGEGGGTLDEGAIEQLLQGGADDPAASGGTWVGGAAPASAVSHDDIELLLRKAEQALASIDQPADQLPPGVKAFKFDDFAGSAANPHSATLELMRDVELDLTIELGRTHMHLEEVLKLKQGAVVPLDKLAGDPADIYVNGRLIARGEVLVLNDNFCVRVAELIVGESACA